MIGESVKKQHKELESSLCTSWEQRLNHTRLILLLALLFCAACYGQDRGRLGYTSEELLGMCAERIERGTRLPSPFNLHSFHYSPIGYASFLSQDFEIVVDGEFQDIPEANGAGPLGLNPKDLSVEFKVMKVYKGSAPDSIEVSLISDMLKFPGENISRFAKRREVIEDLNAQLQPIRDRLDALQASFDGGEVGEGAFRTEREKLLSLRADMTRPYRELSFRTLGQIHGETFYERGGAIRENERYVIGIEPISGNTGSYQLQEDPALPNVFWGEQREDVITAWHSPEVFELATPYGSYDPNRDKHCEILRSLAGPPVEATAGNIATQLLDEYQLVAHGEVYAILEFTPWELRGLESKEVRVRFRIHELFKGVAAGSIDVALNSDMLSVPGEERSRYAERQDMRERALAYMRPHWDRVHMMSRSVDVGNVDRQVYEDERERVFKLRSQYEGESGVSDLRSYRKVSSWLGDTFYERDGVIQPLRSYLIGVNKTSGAENVYLLGELPESPSRIYWGEERDLVLRELEEMVR